jgi:hypothetical protein
MAMSVAMLAAEGAAEGGEVLHELPMAPYLYGLIALALFALALAVTWAFRGTAAKLGNPDKSAHGPGHGTAGSSHH